MTPAIAYYRNVEAYRICFLQIDFLLQILLMNCLILLENSGIISKTCWDKIVISDNENIRTICKRDKRRIELE